MARLDLTAERLRELFEYDPETGVFHRKISSSRWPLGYTVGKLRSDGYRIVYVDGALYRAHRLAWLFTFGEWPNQFIDHINGIRDDNRISNLRDVSAAMNQQNQRKAPVSNKSCGVLGVTWHAGTSCWKAAIKVNGKRIHLGLYKTTALAHEAYVVAKQTMHAGCTL